MLKRLLILIIRLKEIFLNIEEHQKESYGNKVEIETLNAELVTLKKDQADARKALDDLEEVIKKWES